MKVLSFALFFLLLSTVSTAQDLLENRGNYFFIGFSLPIVKVRDLGHSAQLYQGLVPTLSTGYQQIEKDFASRLSFSFSFSMGPFGVIAPKTRPKPQPQMSGASVNIFQVSGGVYKRVGNYDTEGWNRYVGGSLSFTFDGRLYNLPSNNIFGYQCNTSLNVGGFVEKKLDNTWRFNYEAFTPVLSYALRPNHVGMIPLTTGDFSDGAKRFIKSGKILTVNKLFRFYNRFSFDKQINDHRRRQFSYTWDAVVNRMSQPLNSITGGLGTESLFKM